ncbi:unnamed protein product [Rangifer tarandus platyrhynchus]|uniref:Uncharacterized protein n=2 Tax=Rangifer tarandus platyrhynchus TaxID=3082113 RepID=A0AC59YHR8_RANTA|nr:unnamed protein product [Rangifer tarandus platyrhynchus]
MQPLPPATFPRTVGSPHPQVPPGPGHLLAPRVSRFGETPASHGKIKKRARERFPTESLRTPRELPQLSRRRRPPPPPSPRRDVRPGRLRAPSPRRRASLSRPATPLSPRARPRGTPPPPQQEAPTPTRPLLAASPHPTRLAAARLRPGPFQRDAAPRRRPGGPAGAPPERRRPPPRRPPALTRSFHGDAAPSNLTDPTDRALSPAALTRSPANAGGRTHAAARARHPRSAPPGAASFSPGLAGTSAHGSPHRGYF